MLRSATLLGSSSGRNSGDAALIAAIATSVDKACGRNLLYEVPTIRPSYIRDHYPDNVIPVATLPWNFSVKLLGIPAWNSIRRTDLTLIFDAILFDRSLFNPLFNFMSTLYLFLPKARKAGRSMGFYNIGAGPVSTRAGRRMLRDISNMMDFITVRDEDSMAILRDIGVSNPRILLGADAALNAPSASDESVLPMIRRAGLDPEKEILALNINHYIDTWAHAAAPRLGRKKFLEIYAAGANRALNEIGSQVAVITTQHADVPISRELVSRLDPRLKPALISNVRLDHMQIKGVLRRVAMLFGMRLHAMIMASSELTPIIGLAYQPKVHHYYSTLGIREFSLGFEDFTERNIAEHILRGWARRDFLRSHLKTQIPRLQARALAAASVVAAIDRGEDLDAWFRNATNAAER